MSIRSFDDADRIRSFGTGRAPVAPDHHVRPVIRMRSVVFGEPVLKLAVTTDRISSPAC